MKKALLLITINMMIYHLAPAQAKAGMEQYSYSGMPLSEAIVPVYHIQSARKWYGELRYNYEDVQTLSAYAGKTITAGKTLEFSITPMLGFSTGRFTGISLAANSEINWKKFYISSQSQYSIGIKKGSEAFLFNWSELAYNITPRFYTGLSMQYTRQSGQTDIEPGLLAGISFNAFSIPIYVFSPFRQGQYFILGINYEYNFKEKP
jgi:hypothetical protein